MFDVGHSGYQKTPKFTLISEQFEKIALHFIKNLVNKKVKENFSLSIFWQMIIKMAGFIPFWIRFFTLSPVLKAA